MLQHDFHSATPLEMSRKLLSQKHGSMLASCATERDHQILEAAALVAADTRIHQRRDARDKLVNAVLLIEVIDDRSISARKRLKLLFAAGVRQAATVEDKATAISSSHLWEGHGEKKN